VAAGMNPPEEIHNVSMSQFSIARHYGGIRFNGASYTYFSDTDTLVRNDVLKQRKKDKKAAQIKEPKC
jgi:hypothetical protein